MKLSAAGLRVIEVFEGLRLDAYPDPGTGGEPWTIGIGTTVYPDGRPVQLGDRITEAQAREYLAHDVAQFEAAVARLVTVPVTQSQFDALVSLAYNIGAGALERSTLLAKLNAGDYAGAAGEFNRWTNASGRELPGLVRRRRAERTLFEADIGAPIENRTAPPAPAEQPRTPTMAPIIAALLPQLVTLIPELSKLFGSGTAVSDRNIAAAAKVAEAVVSATGAANLQGAIETMQADPAARRTASDAVQQVWYELVEVGGGIVAARTFNAATAAMPAWRMPAVWVSCALLALVFMVVGSVLWLDGWTPEIRLQVVTAVLTIIGMVGSFWLGSTAGSARKTDLLAERQ